jgi:hypothetical protein
MSEIAQNKNTNSDEIDLLDLFRRMGNTLSRWLGAIGRAFLISIVFLLRRWLPLGLSIVAGVGISYALKFTSASFYTSDMVIRSNTITNIDMMLYIERLHNYCLENNDIALTGALSLDSKTAKNIIDINPFWIIEDRKKGTAGMVDYTFRSNAFDTITTRMQDRMDIRVKIKTPSELAFLQKGIISFINKDSLFQQRNRIRIRQNKELLVRYADDILKLDSLQKIKYFEETKDRLPKGGGQMIFLQEQKTQLIYTEIQGLFIKKQVLESERDLYPEIVTVLSDFNFPVKPENGGMYYGKKIIPVFFILTLLLLIYLANRKNIKEVYKKY